MATKLAGGELAVLPTRLRSFFTKYPPHKYSVKAIREHLERTAAEKPDTTSAAGTSTTATTQTESQSPSPLPDADSLPSPYHQNRELKAPKRDPAMYPLSREYLQMSIPGYPNPFRPRKSGGKAWYGPVFGLMKQAKLMKLARSFELEPLMPPSMKSTEYKELRNAEKGLTLKGTGIGEKVKGHKWERTMETRLEERKKAMQEMPELIKNWKLRGHGKGWKKWPKK
ncbi:60S ribosomal protein L25 [Aspergillus sclerotialis]|uniref:60S ribosomal protein L25 n=1 Tax=Aspergillus sclerotialis TaxID=2070753 RepID=A0A3A2ZDP9_9EURO|nr:60S ribosomal protein L25 [Aspergillus sclerotialis]